MKELLKPALLALTLFGTASVLAACDAGDGPAEKAGEEMDEAMEEMGDAMEDMGN